MFNSDITIFNFIYEHCYTLGKIFNLGALEGFIIYAGLIAWVVMYNVNFSKKSRRNKKK